MSWSCDNCVVRLQFKPIHPIVNMIEMQNCMKKHRLVSMPCCDGEKDE